MTEAETLPWRCPTCQVTNAPGFLFCASCGDRIPNRSNRPGVTEKWRAIIHAAWHLVDDQDEADADPDLSKAITDYSGDADIHEFIDHDLAKLATLLDRFRQITAEYKAALQDARNAGFDSIRNLELGARGIAPHLRAGVQERIAKEQTNLIDLDNRLAFIALAERDDPGIITLEVSNDEGEGFSAGFTPMKGD